MGERTADPPAHQPWPSVADPHRPAGAAPGRRVARERLHHMATTTDLYDRMLTRREPYQDKRGDLRRHVIDVIQFLLAVVAKCTRTSSLPPRRARRTSTGTSSNPAVCTISPPTAQSSDRQTQHMGKLGGKSCGNAKGAQSRPDVQCHGGRGQSTRCQAQDWRCSGQLSVVRVAQGSTIS